MLTNRIITALGLMLVSCAGFAQIDKTGYTLVYSSESPEEASALLTLSDEELGRCTGDFHSIENLERNWLYCPRQTSKWNMRMAENDADRARVHICENGRLRMLALSPDSTIENCITSGVRMKQGYRYGIFEIKAKCKPHASNFPAIWMMPSNPQGSWPDCGEIDIMEQIGTSSIVYSTVHLGARYDQPVDTTYTYSDSRWFNTAYHVYSLLWTETCLTFYCDGKQVFQYEKDANLDLLNNPTYEHAQFPYNESYYIILDQALGMNKNWEDEDPDPEFTYEMNVAYVRIFQPSEDTQLNCETLQEPKSPQVWKYLKDDHVCIHNAGKEYNVVGSRIK